jgi:hypothetical protein
VLSRENYILVELLGRDSPQVKALTAAAGMPGMEGAAREMLRGLVRQGGWNPDDLPRFALPRNLSPSDYLIGTAMSGDVAGAEVGLAETDLHGHFGIFGQSGSGKTTAMKMLLLDFAGKAGRPRPRGRTFFIWDARGEYRNLLRLFPPEELVWLDADELGINPFEVPAGKDGKPVMSPEKWIGNVREWLRIFWLNEPSLNLLCEVLLDEYQRRGLLEENGENHG